MNHLEQLAKCSYRSLHSGICGSSKTKQKWKHPIPFPTTRNQSLFPANKLPPHLMQSSPAGFCCLIIKCVRTTKYHPTFEVRKLIRKQKSKRNNKKVKIKTKKLLNVHFCDNPRRCHSLKKKEKSMHTHIVMKIKQS